MNFTYQVFLKADTIIGYGSWCIWESVKIMILISLSSCSQGMYKFRGGFRDFEKGTLYVGHHDWLSKKILDFSCSKKTKITFITKLVFGKIFMSVFSNLLLFYSQNLNNFLKFTNVLIRKQKKTLIQQSIRKKKWEKLDLV